MESVNGALKNSLTLPEQGFWDSLRCSPVVQNGDVSEDDYFFVDDLLDFSKAEQIQSDDVIEEKVVNDVVRVSDTKREIIAAPPVEVHDNDLSVPVDEMAELEWLSNFVDDSTPGYSLTLPPQKPPVKNAGSAHTSAPRTGVRVWPLSESSTSSSSSSPMFQMYNDVTHSAESFMRKPPAKKQKQQNSERRCSHCLVQNTPQWRTGPLGAKTLCNACGVRYKSGRLLPEYRPAISPTFSSEKHSNNHRKVMEMRRKKEGNGGGSGGFGKAVVIF